MTQMNEGSVLPLSLVVKSIYRQLQVMTAGQNDLEFQQKF